MSSTTLEENNVQTASHDLWSVAQGTKNGEPLLIRFRSELPQGLEPAVFPFLLSATWAYQPNESGLPSAEEMESMGKFEDALASSLEESQTAHLMVVLTSNGERDWLWYTTGEDAAMRQVNKALKGRPRYPVEFAVQDDPSWQAYSQFVSGGTSECAGQTLIGWMISKVIRLFCR